MRRREYSNHMNNSRRESAHDLQERGYSVVLLEPDGKRPVLPGWQRLRSTHDLIDAWFGRCPRANLGIHTGHSRIAVADCDSGEAAEWVAANLPESPMFQHTPRGGLHVFFSDPERSVPNRLNVMDIKLDVRSKMSQVVAFPSRCERGQWLLEGLTGPENLPRMPTDWLVDAERAARAVQEPRPPPGESEWVRRVLFDEYWSIEHANGDLNLFRAACFLVQRAGLTDGQALALLREWNLTNAKPPWPDNRLVYKVSEARKLKRG